MQGLLPLLSFAIWIGVWVLVVKKRGKLTLLAGNLIGAVGGFIAATVVLSALASVLPVEQKAASSDSIRSVADTQKESAEQAALRKDAKPRAPVGDEVVDAITLIYLKHKVYATGAVDCVSAVIGERDMIGCRSVRLDGRSNVHVWEYASGKFNSINGSASSLAETKFSSESMIRVSPLPLPSDIDVAAIVDFFNRS